MYMLFSWSVWNLAQKELGNKKKDKKNISYLNEEESNFENCEVTEKKEGKYEKRLEESVWFLNDSDFDVFIEPAKYEWWWMWKETKKPH